MTVVPCACLGPMYGEPYCPCIMHRQGIERSEEWQIANSAEVIAEEKRKIAEAMEEMFNRNKNNE